MRGVVRMSFFDTLTPLPPHLSYRCALPDVPLEHLRHERCGGLSSIQSPLFFESGILFSFLSMLNAFVSRAGPLIPSTPRMRTAAGYFSFPHTRLSIQCMPYVKYTYIVPGFPNIGVLRGVCPRLACDALSSKPS